MGKPLKRIHAKQQRRSIAYNASLDFRRKKGISDPSRGRKVPGSGNRRKQG